VETTPRCLRRRIFLLLAAVLNVAFVVVFPAWILVLCGLLLARARKAVTTKRYFAVTAGAQQD
jgi:hypothetical protein